MDTMEITIGTRLLYGYSCVNSASIVSIVVIKENEQGELPINF